MTPEEEANYREFMRLLYEADALTPEQRAAYEANTGTSQPTGLYDQYEAQGKARMIGGDPYIWVGTDTRGAYQPAADVEAWVAGGGDITDREGFSGRTAPAMPSLTPDETANYQEFMRQLYESGGLTPEQRAAYEANMGITPAPVAPPPTPAPIAPPGPTPPPNMDPALANQFEQGIRNTLAVNNPYDFMDWQSELGGDQRLGEATGGPAGSYGGGAVWNQVIPQSEAPVQFPANVRPYGSGIDPAFGQTPFDPGPGAADQYRGFMKQLYDAGALTPEQRAAYEQNTGSGPVIQPGTSTAIGTVPYNPYAPGNALQSPITSRD